MERRSSKRFLAGTVKPGPKKTSKVWNHYNILPATRSKYGGTRAKAICTHCGHSYDMFHGTNNMRNHLIKKHPEAWMAIDTSPVGTALPPPISGQGNLGEHVTKAPDFFMSAVRWQFMEYHALDALHNDYFQSMIHAASRNAYKPHEFGLLKSSSTCRTATTMRTKTAKMAVAARRIMHGFQSAGQCNGDPFFCSAVADCWTSVAGDGYLNLQLHFIDGDWKLHGHGAGIMPLTGFGHTAAQQVADTVKLLLDAGVTHLHGVTIDTENTMQAYGKLVHNLGADEMVYCLCHILQLVANAIVDNPDVLPLLKDIRKFVVSTRKSNLAHAALKQMQAAAGIAHPLGLILDVRTRWWSTYTMLERVLALKPYLDVDHDDYVTEYDLDREHYTIIRAMVKVLKPLRDMQLFLEGQKYVTISFVPSSLESLRVDLTRMHTELADAGSSIRRETRMSPRIAGAVRNAVMAGLEALVYHFRDSTERFVYQRDGLTQEGRLTGVPTAAWVAALLDCRTKDLLTFLSDDELEKLWCILLEKMGGTAHRRAPSEPGHRPHRVPGLHRRRRRRNRTGPRGKTCEVWRTE
jgi:hypothetical protein